MLICYITAINKAIAEYDGLIKLIQWFITLVVSIIAIYIGGKRLKDLFAFYKQQKFSAAFGYHTIFHHFCQELKVVVDLGAEFWTDTTNGYTNDVGLSDKSNEEDDYENSDEMKNYQERIASFSSDFLKFLRSEKGQIPIVTNKKPDTMLSTIIPQSLAQQSKDEQYLSVWSKNLSRLFDILVNVSIINDYNAIPYREKTKKELIELTDFFISLTIKEIAAAQKDYNQLT